MRSAWLVSFIRIPLLILGLLLMFTMLWLLGLGFSFPFLPELSTVYFTLVNVVSFLLLRRLLKQEGRSVRSLVDYRPARIKRDILDGFLWLVVLYVPFLIAVVSVMLAIYGRDFINHFETVFAGDMQAYSFFRPAWLMWLGAAFSLVFPFLNAPVEELMYKGYAQTRLTSAYGPWIGVLIPSAGFALQHMLLAPSLQGALVYLFAFFLWGIVSGIIYTRRKRLLPLIICHFIVNLLFGVLPLVFLLSGAK